MFLNFSKVCVVESSIKGNNIGPKINSKGYIISSAVLRENIPTHQGDFNNWFDDCQNHCNNSFENMGMRNNEIYLDGNFPNPIYAGGYALYLKIIEVVFIKYGFEKGTRKERKRLVNVFPVFEASKSEKATMPVFTPKVLKVLKVVIPRYYHDNMDFVILAPDCSRIIDFYRTENTAEFKAWATSILMNPLTLVTLCYARDVNWGTVIETSIKREMIKTGRLPRIETLMEEYPQRSDLVYALSKLATFVNGTLIKQESAFFHENRGRILDYGKNSLKSMLINQIWKPRCGNALLYKYFKENYLDEFNEFEAQKLKLIHKVVERQSA